MPEQTDPTLAPDPTERGDGFGGLVWTIVHPWRLDGPIIRFSYQFDDEADDFANYRLDLKLDFDRKDVAEIMGEVDPEGFAGDNPIPPVPESSPDLGEYDPEGYPSGDVPDGFEPNPPGVTDHWWS